MGNRLARVFGLLAAMLLCSDGSVFSAEEPETETLRGVKSFDLFVRVRSRDAGAQQLGITQDLVQRDVEERLEKAQVKPVRNAEAHLIVTVSILSISHPRVDGILAYVTTVQMKFRQGAVLDTTGTRAAVTTWDEIRFGATSPTKDLDKRIRRYIGDLTDVFLRDYLAANAKSASTDP